MKVQKYVLISLLALSACNIDKKGLSPIESNAIDSAIINFLSINDDGKDMVLIFNKEYNDDKITIYEYSSSFLSSIDTIKCKYSFMKFEHNIIIRDGFNDNSKLFLGTFKTIDDFITYDPNEAILIINHNSGNFEIVNFGQRYIPLNEKICEVRLIIEKLRDEVLIDTLLLQ